LCCSPVAAINYTYDITLSLDLINLTRTAIQQMPAAQGLKFVGLSTSMFDVSLPHLREFLSMPRAILNFYHFFLACC